MLKQLTKNSCFPFQFQMILFFFNASSNSEKNNWVKIFEESINLPYFEFNEEDEDEKKDQQQIPAIERQDEHSLKIVHENENPKLNNSKKSTPTSMTTISPFKFQTENSDDDEKSTTSNKNDHLISDFDLSDEDENNSNINSDNEYQQKKQRQTEQFQKLQKQLLQQKLEIQKELQIKESQDKEKNKEKNW